MRATRRRRLEKHIKQLCDEHDIEFTVKEGRGHAKVKSRQIQIPPIQEDMDYFVALHEVGHIMGGLGGLRLDREGKAWTWALKHALFEPEYPIRQRICSLLVRYLFRARAKGWKIPEEGDFWENMVWW